MKLIKKIFIRGNDVYEEYEELTLPDTNSGVFEGIKVRFAARAIILNQEGKIAFLETRKGLSHKIPGGGVDEGEDIITELQREAKEEIGADITIEKELGVVVQYNDDLPFHVSFGYLCAVKGDIVAPQLTEKELAHKFKLMWVDFETAKKLLLEETHNEAPERETVRRRELAFIEEGEKMTIK